MKRFFQYRTLVNWTVISHIHTTKELGIGALVHQLGHTLGISDLFNYDPEQTQGIISYNLTQDALVDFYQACIDKAYDCTHFNCLKASLLYTVHQNADSYSYTISFMPISMFSLYQYRSNTLEPFVIFNKT